VRRVGAAFRAEIEVAALTVDLEEGGEESGEIYIYFWNLELNILNLDYV
jgi:hypothetical protein